MLDRLVNDEFTHARKEGRREAYAFDPLGRVFRGHDQQPDNDDEPAQQRKHRGPSYLAILRLDTKPSCAGTCKVTSGARSPASDPSP